MGCTADGYQVRNENITIMPQSDLKFQIESRCVFDGVVAGHGRPDGRQ